LRDSRDHNKVVKGKLTYQAMHNINFNDPHFNKAKGEVWAIV